MLGRHGRLGNQMFQYAALRGLASHHGYEFCIPYSEFTDPWHDHQLFEAFELSGLSKQNIRSNDVQTRVQEQHFHFDQELFEKCPDNVDICGYFQTERYFSHIRNEIKRDFTFKDNISLSVQEYRNQIESDEVISLHIRRGDYVNQPWHGCCPLQYYEKALSMLHDDLPVIICTDDLQWVLDKKLLTSDRFYVCQGNDNLFDMCAMSRCDYHVIANSTFSWWGAWLANSKKVIAPTRWFGPPFSEQKNTRDLIPDRWEKISPI